jgi:ABC-type transporter Mla subunit MlaD
MKTRFPLFGDERQAHAGGQLIELRAERGDGLVEGAPLRYRGLEVGKVEKVRLSDDLAAVLLDVRVTAAETRIARAGSRFWVVRPELGLARSAALDTLEAVLEALPEPLHGLLQGVTGIAEVYNRLERSAAEEARKVLHSGSPAISRAFAYLLLRWRELRSVRAVLRGRHLDLPTAKILLAMYDAGAGRA